MKRPAVDAPGLRPLRRLTPRTAWVLAGVTGFVVVALVANLVVTVVGDRDGDHPRDQPPGAGPADTPLPPLDSEVDDFALDDGAAPGAFPGLGASWDVEGEMRVTDGVLRAVGPAVASVEVPEGDRYLHTVVVSPNDGWSIAFSYGSLEDHWAVALGPAASTLLHVVGGVPEVVAREPITTGGYVEVMVTWRDGRLLVRSAGFVLFDDVATPDMDVGRIAVIAAGTTPGGVDSVAVRAL